MILNSIILICNYTRALFVPFDMCFVFCFFTTYSRCEKIIYSLSIILLHFIKFYCLYYQIIFKNITVPTYHTKNSNCIHRSQELFSTLPPQEREDFTTPETLPVLTITEQSDAQWFVCPLSSNCGASFPCRPFPGLLRFLLRTILRLTQLFGIQ